MKRLTALILALAFFAAPTLVLAADWPSLSDMFAQYDQTIYRDDA